MLAAVQLWHGGERILYHLGDRRKGDFLLQERFHGYLIGGIERTSSGFRPPPARDRPGSTMESAEIRRLEIPMARRGPVQPRPPARARGRAHVSAYWMGMRISVAQSCAITLPSLYSTIACTVDCGWTTTSISLGAKPNSQQASITSNPLFISVAESMVILGPIFQVGCCKASAGVTRASFSMGVVRNGPPEAVRISFLASERRPARRHWWPRCARCRPGSARRRTRAPHP